MLNQQQSDQTPLTNMQNIGSTIADRLKNVGIVTLADLRQVGPAEAYQRLRLNDPTATLPMCYYLYFAVRGTRRQELATTHLTRKAATTRRSRYRVKIHA